MLSNPSSYLRLYNPSEIYNSSVLQKSFFTFQTAKKGQTGFAVRSPLENLLNLVLLVLLQSNDSQSLISCQQSTNEWKEIMSRS